MSHELWYLEIVLIITSALAFLGAWLMIRAARRTLFPPSAKRHRPIPLTLIPREPRKPPREAELRPVRAPAPASL